jgi:hypothetical protein
VIVGSTLFSTLTSLSKKKLNLLKMLREEILSVEKESVALGGKMQRTGYVEVHMRILGRDQRRQVTGEDCRIVST